MYNKELAGVLPNTTYNYAISIPKHTLMENKLITEINIEGKAITYFDSFDLEQQFNGHHYFELRFKQHEPGRPDLINLDTCRDFIGKTLTASFGHYQDKMQEFIGLVTHVALAQNHGYHGHLIVSGYSPTILIDRGADLGSYLDKTLNEIVSLVTRDIAENDLKIVCNPTRKTPIGYLIQYQESDFNLLNRLAATYHEWFFYDGKQLHFGKPDQQKEVALYYGRDIHQFQYGMEIAPLQQHCFDYNPITDEILQSGMQAALDGSPDHIHAVTTANRTYSKTLNHTSPIRMDNSDDVKKHQENEAKANASRLLKITGKGDNAGLCIGNIAEILMSMRHETDFITESIGKFLITGINHHIDVAGKYHHTFEGLTAGTECINVSGYQKPNPAMQLADVTDNHDPLGQGRIKVKFKWICTNHDVSDWLRIVTPDAGSSVAVNTNRGFVFIPEIGDQVVVGFEDGNIAKPIVLGSIFHGLNGTGGNTDNHLKTIATRSGHTIEFNDSSGAETITITDKNNNIIRFDTQASSIEISAPENINISAKNIHINAGQLISISAGDHIYTNAGANIASNAGENHSITADNISIIADNHIHKTATHIEKTAENISLNSTNNHIELRSAEEIINKSGGKIKLF